MTGDLVRRPTEVFTMPLEDGCHILHPEFAVIKFGRTVTVDVGALCYLERYVPTVTTRQHGRKVALTSLCPKRREHVRHLLDLASQMAASGRRTDATLQSLFSRFVAFMTWADTNGWPDVLGSAAAARTAVSAYVEHLRDRVARNDMSLNGGARQQDTTLTVLGEFFDDYDYFSRGFYRLRRDSATAVVTTPPSEWSQGRVLGVAQPLFDGICDLVLGRKAFPHAISMPEFVGLKNNTLWAFPGSAWFRTPAMEAAARTGLGYNYSEGRLATPDELKALLPGGLRWYWALGNARDVLNAANADFQCPARWRMSTYATYVYFLMFIAATGMSYTQAANMEWGDDYEVAVSHQGFRSIKWRAGGKVVSFELPISSLPSFKRYIELRDFSLQGRASDRLFFSSNTSRSPLRPFTMPIAAICKMLNRIDPALPEVGAKQWRAAKSDWLVRNTDPSTAALVLQNTERVVLRHYAEGSESLHREEMGRFLNAVSSAVISPGMTLSSLTPLAVGGCTLIGSPIPMESPQRTKPDCENAEGCLFCERFKVHVDDVDTRKLLSCRYAIQLVTPHSANIEEYQEVIEPILLRIDAVVAEISSHNPEMVKRVKVEVDEEGILDPYWSSKVEMLMTLGL